MVKQELVAGDGVLEVEAAEHRHGRAAPGRGWCAMPCRHRRGGCYPGVVERGAVLRWIAGHRAAERRRLELMRQEGPMSPESSFRAAMELCDLAVPMEHDPVRDREIEEARRLWAKLKEPWLARRA